MNKNPEKLGEKYDSKESNFDAVKGVDNKIDLPEGVEGAINAMGRVSENAREDISGDAKDSSTSTTRTGAGTQDSHQVHVKRLLKNAPSPKVMVKQIHDQINKEMSKLLKESKKLSKQKNVDYYRMNNTVKKIRSLKGVLSSLLTMSLDGIKTLWLRFVHGIM